MELEFWKKKHSRSPQSTMCICWILAYFSNWMQQLFLPRTDLNAVGGRRPTPTPHSAGWNSKRLNVGTTADGQDRVRRSIVCHDFNALPRTQTHTQTTTKTHTYKDAHKSAPKQPRSLSYRKSIGDASISPHLTPPPPLLPLLLQFVHFRGMPASVAGWPRRSVEWSAVNAGRPGVIPWRPSWRPFSATRLAGLATGWRHFRRARSPEQKRRPHRQRP